MFKIEYLEEIQYLEEIIHCGLRRFGFTSLVFNYLCVFGPLSCSLFLSHCCRGYMKVIMPSLKGFLRLAQSEWS